MSNEAIRLLLTVSGGLEDLAERQLRSCFTEIMESTWQKGPSGSQLYLSLPSSQTTPARIAETIHELNFVEYVYLRLDFVTFAIESVEREEDLPLLLEQLEQAAARIAPSSMNLCKTVCESMADKSSPAVGSEGLPGVLLPTPHSFESSASVPSIESSEEFAVNPVYTQSHVAQVVVDTILEFCIEYYPSCKEKDDLWLDAGSGNGALLGHLPLPNSIGVDTNPLSTRVLQMDFLKLTTSFLKTRMPDYRRLFVVSNPPFSLSNRGDYTPIVQFINHSIDALQAEIVAVICPSKFARIRIWRALDLTKKAQLLGRFLLPENAFYNPATGKVVHIHSYCLIFGRAGIADTEKEPGESHESKNGAYISSKRDKGHFPYLSTADLTAAIAKGLAKAGVELVAERKARYMLQAKLLYPNVLELWYLVNPRQPCSLANSCSMQVPNHSLGWLSISCKPPIALALASKAMNNDEGDDDTRCPVAVNLMGGEGTIELEACRAVSHSYFLLSGDKSFYRALKNSQHVQTFKKHSHRNLLIDFVVWDAQNLPLRPGIADAVLADLPFQGSRKKIHQEPVVGASSEDSKHSLPLDYSTVLRHACRILKPKGRAALLSPDFKALRHAAGGFNWRPLWYSNTINLGGLSGKLYVMERQSPCSKDLSMWVPSNTSDMSAWIQAAANSACDEENLEEVGRLSLQTPPVTSDTEDRNSARICSLNDLLQETIDIGACQIAYVFVAGGLDKGPTQMLLPNHTHPIAIPTPPAIQEQEPDLVYLNIQENMNDGKTPTFYKYASMMAEHFENTTSPFHYVIKMDLDLTLFVPTFLAFAKEHFPLDIKQVNIGKKIRGGKSKYLWGSGCLQIVSVDLAKAITCPESVGKMERAEDEDKEISKRINIYGTNATRIWLDEKYMLYQPSKTPNMKGLNRKAFDFTDILYGHTEWGATGRWSRMTPGPYFKYLPKARKIWRHFLYWYTQNQTPVDNAYHLLDMPRISQQDLLVRPNDYIVSNQDFDSSPIVLKDYKLVFFPIEGNGAESWRCLFRRMLGFEDWQDTTKQFDGLVYLKDYDLKEATEIMTSPDYTRAIFVQSPKSRLLSSYVTTVLSTENQNNTLMQSICCGSMKQLTVPGSEHYLNTCSNQAKPISFERFSNIIQDCDHPYWRPQSRRMEPKYYQYLNFIGHYETAQRDAKQLFQQIGVDWDKYGSNGWGHNGTESMFANARIWNVEDVQQLHPQSYEATLNNIASRSSSTNSIYKTDYDEKLFNFTT
eukprot:scaffold2927_cov143-Cylindrotheca_fusiformis.AAC.6